MVVMSESSVVIVRMSSVMVVSPFHTGQGSHGDLAIHPDQQAYTGSMVVMSESSAVIVRMSSAMVCPPFCLACSQRVWPGRFVKTRTLGLIRFGLIPTGSSAAGRKASAGYAK